jgi:TRAP-type C4-dicarboxylate transport system permease small subunit
VSEQRTIHPPGDGAPHVGAPPVSLFGRFTQGLNIVGTVVILIMAVAVNADVIGREAFNRPIAGVLEFIGLSIVAVVFLQMANTLREDRHVSNDIIIRLFAVRYPRVTAALYSLFNLIGAVLMALIVIFVWPIAVEAYEGDYYSGTAGVIEIPIWPFMIVVVIGAATTLVQFLIDASRFAARAGRLAPG